MTQARETWRLYRFDTSLPCRHGHRHRLYIGISNEPMRRVLEHGKTQLWWPHVTGWAVDERVFYSEADARAAERAAILAELPLANTVHNLGNPCRMEFTAHPKPAKVARQTVARAAAGRALPALTAEQQARWLRVQLWSGAWLTLFVGSVAAAVMQWHVAAGNAIELSAIGVSVLLGAARYVTLPRRRQLRAKRWVGNVVAVATLAAVAAAVVWVLVAGHASGAVAR